MTGLPVPPARPSLSPDSLLDSIAITEAISADQVGDLACLLRNADLAECAGVLDNLLARELVFSPLYVAMHVLQEVGKELKADSSPGNRVITLSRALCERFCDPCVASGGFRSWALDQKGHGHDS